MPHEDSRAMMFSLIFLAVVINVIAQSLLKIGMGRIGFFEFVPHNIIPVGMKVATSVPIILGIACYVMSVAVWLMVLSRVEVSLAYPLSSVGYVLMAITAYFLFGEDVTPLRMIGICVIVFGVYLLSRTA